MVQLPRFAALQSKYNHKYLRYLHETCSPVHTFLQYSGEEIPTPFTKFEFEPAECDPSLVHIRCCYNQKYWCSWPSDHHFIVAGAEQKQEDKSKWSCTLFSPVYDSCHESFRFRHVHLGYNVVLWRVGPPFGECLRAQWSDPDSDLCDLSIVINWESLYTLPKRVAFKGDNGSYLKALLINNLPYLQFASSNIEDPTIQMETFSTKDGRIRIKSNYMGKFWKRGTSNWIFADSTDATAQNLDTVYSPTKLASNIVALRNVGNGNFVKRFTTGSKISLLNAQIKEIDVHARLEMTELVRSRKIYNVEFRHFDARISEGISIVLTNGEATNNTRVPITAKLNLSFTSTRTSTWTSSISTKLDHVKTILESGVPIIVDGRNIDTWSIRFVGEYKWGETITTSKKEVKTYEVTIPPMSTITVTLIATSGSCEVPFSYKQSDTLLCGNAVEYYLEDGVYRGTNYYNFKYETKTKPFCGCPS